MMKILFTLFTLLFLGTLHAQVYHDYIGAGHTQDVIVTTSHEESTAMSSVNGFGLGKNLQAASRFLSQATLGANLQEIIYVDSIGFESWIDQQMNIPQSGYLDMTEEFIDLAYQRYIEAGLDPEDFQENVFFFRYAWWHINTQNPDLLRHKIALALSELLVISDQSDLSAFGPGMANYYDILSRNAFGNYKDLLMDVTLNPMMGFYLSHLNNPKSIPELNIHPDENYAREIMQLFTIGLYQLNPDGTRKIGDDGLFIPTYNNDDIAELAKVFTGLSAGAWNEEVIGQPLQFGIPIYFANREIPMRMWEPWHESGPKTLLGDVVIPAGQSGIQDIEMAIDYLFNHPNVGPFISTHLIKRLVKSNPTPSYVERIAAVFNDNGNGVRGDLGAVIKAILLDYEARDCIWIDQFSNGKLREPIHRYVQLLRAFNVKTDNGYFINTGVAFQVLTEQHPMSSPTVFNFFLPDYQPNGEIADAELVAPEFQIFNSQTSIGYINLLQYWLFADYLNELPDILGDDEDEWMAYLDADELDYLGQRTSGLADYLDLVFGHGNLSDETIRPIEEYSELLDDQNLRIRMAVFLTMLSPDYTIMK